MSNYKGSVLNPWASGGKTIQYASMPAASAAEQGKIVQFIGTTTADYTNGYFYECISDGAATPTYSWTRKNVQPADESTIESKTIAASGWSDLASSDPFVKQATVTATKTLSSDSLVELLNDNAVSFATYGFSIGSISGQSVVIYALSAPSADVTLKLNIK